MKSKSKKNDILLVLDKLEEKEKQEVLNYIDKIKNKKHELLEENKTLKKEIDYIKQLNIADIANLTKKYNQKEHEIKKYGASKLGKDIIQPIDLFKKVVNTPIDNEHVKAYVMGFEMITHQLNSALESNGIIPMNVKMGDKFDPIKHEATELVENSDFAPNTIVSVINDGYMIFDKVLIYANVKVSK